MPTSLRRPRHWRHRRRLPPSFRRLPAPLPAAPQGRQCALRVRPGRSRCSNRPDPRSPWPYRPCSPCDARQGRVPLLGNGRGARVRQVPVRRGRWQCCAPPRRACRRSWQCCPCRSRLQPPCRRRQRCRRGLCRFPPDHSPSAVQHLPRRPRRHRPRRHPPAPCRRRAHFPCRQGPGADHAGYHQEPSFPFSLQESIDLFDLRPPLRHEPVVFGIAGRASVDFRRAFGCGHRDRRIAEGA
ncbi:hypothetical protein D9M72_434010 [compost metagenome]